MIKPVKIKKGDTIAIVSLSSGMAGEDDFIWRTKQGLERLESVFGLKYKVMPNALKGSEYLYAHPEKRAEDFNQAVLDPEVKAIICTIGGTESVRIMPYIDVEAFKQNPKIFMGYSDTTVQHLYFYQHGITTYYGPALLTDFAENVKMDEYTISQILNLLFTDNPVGRIYTSETVRKFGLLWDEIAKDFERENLLNPGYEVINGVGKVQGHLIGGCVESLNHIQGTKYFPEVSAFKDAILFLETSERHTHPEVLEQYIRTYAVMGIFDIINGMIIGRPQDGVYYEEIKAVFQKILKEIGREDLPVFYNASFGHNEPKGILPYGVQAELDTYNKTFTILENAVE
ncbi:S66 family peptidase [Macrococcoides bohemicum]|uniref:S66 family peptidase n=1 Tax=Macrococcoides bohemicum TaxID=1903056 RepID=UPI00193FE1F8|nr:S66 peptidase family protein [Macrococcus bohemicus]QRN49616.1 LD-carboxypeptidase [Macrococcus bohemicus]